AVPRQPPQLSRHGAPAAPTRDSRRTVRQEPRNCRATAHLRRPHATVDEPSGKNPATVAPRRTCGAHTRQLAPATWDWTGAAGPERPDRTDGTRQDGTPAADRPGRTVVLAGGTGTGQAERGSEGAPD